MNVLADLNRKIASGMSREDAERSVLVEQQVLAIVQRQIFCPVSGEVLDIRTAVALVTGPDRDDVITVVSPATWSTFREHITAKLATVNKTVDAVYVNGKEV